jgi:hypothetical protein
MKVMFLCASTAAGRDGVGDYTLRLASATEALGHSAQVVALVEDGGPARINSRIQEWNPDWVSLQLVPWGLHPRGLMGDWVLPVRHLREGRRLHIMAHEIWLGVKPRLILRHRILGWLQKRSWKQALAVWQPDAFHVSNLIYQLALQSAGWKPRILPLFGNIPIHPSSDEWANRVRGCFPQSVNKVPLILFPFNWPATFEIGGVLRQLDRLARLQGTPLRLLQIGQIGSGQSVWQRVALHANRRGWATASMGPCPGELISQALQMTNLMVSPYHWQLAGKSGSVLAAWEHGVPVLCAGTQPEADNAILAHLPQHPPVGVLSISSLRDADLMSIAASVQRDRIRGESLTRVAAKWLADLEQSDGISPLR